MAIQRNSLSVFQNNFRCLDFHQCSACRSDKTLGASSARSCPGQHLIHPECDCHRNNFTQGNPAQRNPGKHKGTALLFCCLGGSRTLTDFVTRWQNNFDITLNKQTEVGFELCFGREQKQSSRVVGWFCALRAQRVAALGIRKASNTGLNVKEKSQNKGLCMDFSLVHLLQKHLLLPIT